MITLHHLSSTGGTVITKLLSTSDDLFSLNEKHPLRLWPMREDVFAPTLLVEELFNRYGQDINQKLPPESIGKLIAECFFRDLAACKSVAEAMGRQLLVRDWSHPDFLMKNSQCQPQMLNMCGNIKELKPSLSLVTLRDPVDAYLSGVRSNFLSDIENDWETYCQRTGKFYQAYRALGATMYKYEDIVSAPKQFLDEISQLTNLSFPENFEDKLDRYSFSGDSGRSASKLSLRPPREEDVERRNALIKMDCYKAVADLMGY